MTWGDSMDLGMGGTFREFATPSLIAPVSITPSAELVRFISRKVRITELPHALHTRMLGQE